MRIRNPEEVLEKYPHQLSGGMLQRIMIGIATSMKPSLLIADEPTTAIDAITQLRSWTNCCGSSRNTRQRWSLSPMT